jgi:hypothetical protein
MRRAPRAAAVLAVLLALGSGLACAEGTARADDTIKRPGDHPKYAVEIEPHLLWGWTHYNYAPVDGFGLGARFSIPIVENGFVPSINNSVAITFGVDWLHYSGTNCYYVYFGPHYGGPCYDVGDANYLFFPVAMQWNFFVAQRWSVFGEPGLVIWHGFYDYCNNAPPGYNCGNPTATGVDLAIYLGGRYYVSDHVALVMRIGYPTFSFGVGFM